jgi:hypothetical protein
LFENYIQSLKTSLLQTIIDTNKKNKTIENMSNLKGSKTNVISQKNDKVANNTTKGVTKPINTQDCSDMLFKGGRYQKFTSTTSTTTTVNYSDVITLINTKINGKQKKLGYIVFSKMYLNSNQTDSLKTQSNNYSGTDLISDWGASVDEYFTTQYYCGNSNGKIKPYVVFDSLEKNVDFLISRYDKSSDIVQNITSTEITKFIILYSEAINSKENVYTTMNSTDISNIESNVTKAISLYNQITGNYTNTP